MKLFDLEQKIFAKSLEGHEDSVQDVMSWQKTREGATACLLASHSPCLHALHSLTCRRLVRWPCPLRSARRHSSRHSSQAEDYFIMIPNGAGLGLSAIQVVLYSCYCGNGKAASARGEMAAPMMEENHS